MLMRTFHSRFTREQSAESSPIPQNAARKMLGRSQAQLLDDGTPRYRGCFQRGKMWAFALAERTTLL